MIYKFILGETCLPVAETLQNLANLYDLQVSWESIIVLHEIFHNNYKNDTIYYTLYSLYIMIFILLYSIL